MNRHLGIRTEPIYKNALEAWRALGGFGLEIHGRDADFGELLRVALNPSAPDLFAALKKISTNEFVRTFLGAAAPYVQMLQGIMRMFELAEAKQGKHHWRIAFDDFDANLEHFMRWEEKSRNLGDRIECPEASEKDWWQILEVLRQEPITSRKGATQWAFWDIDKTTSGVKSAVPANEPWMRDLWALIVRAEQVLANCGLNLQSSREDQARTRFPPECRRELFTAGNICRLQFDYGISQLAAAYSVLLENSHARERLGPSVQEVIQPLSRSWFWAEADIEDLKSFLELPVWQKRHEFYSAWIASEMIDVFRESGIDVLAEDGAITFPFRETKVALLPPWSLISERRTKLLGPAGKGRAGGVQPDYSWWRIPPGESEEACGLVIEVKHYKRAARGPWVDVLDDYARAHPNAEVLLVNYGPEGTAKEHVAKDHSERCEIIGELRPGSGEAIAKFRSVLREHVKVHSRVRRALVLDVSASMKLSQRHLADMLKRVGGKFGAEVLIGVDQEIIGRHDLHSITENAVRAMSRAFGENFEGPFNMLLREFDQLILITDKDGADSVRGSKCFLVREDSHESLDGDLQQICVALAHAG